MGKKMEDIVNFFYEIGTLRRIKRSYHINLMQDTESVAEHSHRAMIIAYVLAKVVKADPYKAMLMSAFHDIPETRIGDSNWLQKPYLQQDEEKALDSQMKLLGRYGKEITEELEEYAVRESLESQVAKDADYIEYFLSLKELELTGNVEAKRRLRTENTSLDHMFTEEGKKIAKLVKEGDPTDWTRADLVKSHKKYTRKK